MYCGCTFESVSYTVSRGSGDWSRTNFVSVRIEPLARGVPFSLNEITLLNTSGAMTYRANTQCMSMPDVQITRNYSLAGGISCTFVDRVTGRTSLAIPAATATGTTCTAPAL
jgi:hypothetical protein